MNCKNTLATKNTGSKHINTTFRAAAVQDSPVWLDLGATVEKACQLIRTAARGTAQIVAFPESFIPGFPYWVFTHPASETGDWHRRLHANAVELGGLETRRIAEVCAEANIIAVVGVTERDGVERPFETASKSA